MARNARFFVVVKIDRDIDLCIPSARIPTPLDGHLLASFNNNHSIVWVRLLRQVKGWRRLENTHRSPFVSIGLQRLAKLIISPEGVQVDSVNLHHHYGGPERARTSKYGPAINGCLLPLSNHHACWRQLILVSGAKTDLAVLG